MGWFHSVCVCVVHTVLLEATAVGSGSVVWSLWVRANSIWELWRAVISTFYWWFHNVCVCVWYILFCWRQLQWAVVQWSGHSGSGQFNVGALASRYINLLLVVS